MRGLGHPGFCFRSIRPTFGHMATATQPRPRAAAPPVPVVGHGQGAIKRGRDQGNNMAPSRARVLVVDDVPENRDLLVRRLNRLEINQIDQASNGVEALAAIAAGHYDLVLPIS